MVAAQLRSVPTSIATSSSTKILAIQRSTTQPPSCRFDAGASVFCLILDGRPIGTIPIHHASTMHHPSESSQYSKTAAPRPNDPRRNNDAAKSEIVNAFSAECTHPQNAPVRVCGWEPGYGGPLVYYYLFPTSFGSSSRDLLGWFFLLFSSLGNTHGTRHMQTDTIFLSVPFFPHTPLDLTLPSLL